MKEIIINFFGGTYGSFLAGFLSENINNETMITPLGDFHHMLSLISYNSKNFNIKLTHGDIQKDDKNNIKITYKSDNIDLIARLKWHKTPLDQKNQSDLFFKNIDIDFNNEIKKIVSISFFKGSLLTNLVKWNTIEKEDVIQLPFDFFLAEKEEWIDNFLNIFTKLDVLIDKKYISDAYKIFYNTQYPIFKKHRHNELIEWNKKDSIAKSNIIGQLYYEKYSKNKIPIDVIKYKNNLHMLCEWVKILDKNNGDINCILD